MYIRLRSNREGPTLGIGYLDELVFLLERAQVIKSYD